MSVTDKKTMVVNGTPVIIEDEKNILDVIRKAGFDMPTLCYYSKLSTYGACRMCIVEDERGSIMASCSTPPKAGMNIRTNTPRLREYRKMILELMLSNHNRDCTTCEKRHDCQLKELAQRFGIDEVRFESYRMDKAKDTSSDAIIRDPDKCILCGDCVRMCSEIQNVGAIDFTYRGSNAKVSTAFNMPIAESTCVNCGQCAAVCPTAAITVKSNIQELWEMLADDDIIVEAQIAPAVRVALGDAFDMPKGTNVMGKIIAALRKMGFDEVYDTATGADLTVIEEAAEFIERFEKGENLPMFTSCCPAWVKYAETFHKDLTDNVSSCKSPMEMFGAVLKERAAEREKSSGRKTKVVAIMPCTAKKFEVRRKEMTVNGEQGVDLAITTQELANMIREIGLRFDDILPEAVDMPFGIASGAGVIFGVTGGVTEAVIRTIAKANRAAIDEISFTGVRGFDGVKEIKIPYKDKEMAIAVISGLKNAEELIQSVKNGEKYYDFIEVMACPGGCIGGAGQPYVIDRARDERADGMYEADRLSNVRVSGENPVAENLYSTILAGDNAHRLLHYK